MTKHEFTTWIQNRNRSDDIGRPYQSEDVIPCGDKPMHFYVGATPFLMACNSQKQTICRILLEQMRDELHLDKVWEKTTALIMACENNWGDIADLILESKDANALYSPTTGHDAIYYARKMRNNESLLKKLEDIRASRRTAREQKYYHGRLADIYNKTRKRLPPEMDNHIVDFIATDDGQPGNAPLSQLRGRSADVSQLRGRSADVSQPRGRSSDVSQLRGRGGKNRRSRTKKTIGKLKFGAKM